MEFFSVVGIIALVFTIFVVIIYNGLVAKRNQVDNADSAIEVMLKKRFDLIPNLVETVKEYTTHEKDLLENITQLRSQVANANLSTEEKLAVEQQLGQQLSQLRINVENYPDLKASDNFINLQQNLNEVESQLSAARRTYNAAVLNLNNGIDQFPSNLVANMFNFKKRAFFEIDEIEMENPNIKKMFNA